MTVAIKGPLTSIVAGLVFLLIGISSAHAQSYFCSRPGEPSIPDGSYEERWEMESAQDEVQDYINQMNEYLECLRNESSDARDEARRVQSEMNDAISNFNSR